MKRATYDGWLLETACTLHGNSERCLGRRWSAWVSDPGRRIIGYATPISNTEADAVRMALVDAGNHYRADQDALAGLEAEYFGHCGMLATNACANSGQ